MGVVVGVNLHCDFQPVKMQEANLSISMNYLICKGINEISKMCSSSKSMNLGLKCCYLPRMPTMGLFFTREKIVNNK